MTHPKFVALVLDGLRPDLVTAELMPSLAAFRDRASVMVNSRAQYPTHTRVNKTSFTTGSIPKYHGVFSNRMYDPALSETEIVDIADPDLIARTDDSAPIITATTCGEALAAASKRLAVIHCGAAGAAALFNSGGKRFGHEHLSLAGYAFGTHKLATKVREALGGLPDASGVNHARSAFAIRAFTEVVYPQIKPDVTVIWSDEPDKSLHMDGLLGDKATAAIRHADTLVGDLVSWWRERADTDNLHLMVLSDHGHSKAARNIDMLSLMRGAGFAVTSDPREHGAVLVPFAAGGLHVRDMGRDWLTEITGWLQAQEWCGNLVTDDLDGVNGVIPGTFSKKLLGLDHPRSADLLFTLRHTDMPGDPLGNGDCVGMGASSPTGSLHGAMHRTQMRTVTFLQGPAFKQNHVSAVPGGMVDLMPTILDLMGIERPPTMVGRPLRDLYASGGEQVDADKPVETVSVSAGAYSQHVDLRRLTGRPVVEHGWTERS